MKAVLERNLLKSCINTKKHCIYTRNEEDSRIRYSGTNDNRTRRHPVDLLAGHLFIDSNEQSEATHDRGTDASSKLRRIKM